MLARPLGAARFGAACRGILGGLQIGRAFVVAYSSLSLGLTSIFATLMHQQDFVSLVKMGV